MKIAQISATFPPYRGSTGNVERSINSILNPIGS
jgi:hypothetical protein